MSIPRDTSPEAAKVQLEIYRRMTGSQRVELAYRISMSMRETAASRIRAEHPEWGEEEIKRELLRLAFFPNPLPRGF